MVHFIMETCKNVGRLVKSIQQMPLQNCVQPLGSIKFKIAVTGWPNPQPSAPIDFLKAYMNRLTYRSPPLLPYFV